VKVRQAKGAFIFIVLGCLYCESSETK